MKKLQVVYFLAFTLVISTILSIQPRTQFSSKNFSCSLFPTFEHCIFFQTVSIKLIAEDPLAAFFILKKLFPNALCLVVPTSYLSQN